MIDRCLTNFFSRMMLLFAICFSLQCNQAFSVKVIQHVDSDEKVRCSRKPKPNQKDSVKFLGFIEFNKKVECSLCHQPCVLKGNSGPYYKGVEYYKYENKEPNFCARCFKLFILPFEVGLVVTKLKITKNWVPLIIYQEDDNLTDDMTAEEIEALKSKDGNFDLLADEQPLVCVLNKKCMYCLEEIKFDLYRDMPYICFCPLCFTTNHVFCGPNGSVRCACGIKVSCSKVDYDNTIMIHVWQAYFDNRFYDYYNAVGSGTDRFEVLNRYYKSEEEKRS